MKLRFLLIFISLLSSLTQMDAQRKTTSVKGYTRKDGTYVRPHTRNHNSGIGHSSYNSDGGLSSSDSSESETSINNKKMQSGQYLNYTSEYDGDKIEKSKLISIQNSDPESKDGNIIYLSVLYYNGNIIDICPVTKNIINKWDFDSIYHSIDQDKLTPEHALDLISNYHWSIYKEKITKSFKYVSSYDKPFPSYLAKSIESIKLK
ncbi:hypothetical protein [Chryseobacterium lathyri]|uniref:hypothetical protein n=1 Tax=Chryseobacterium lathyri TaxID=395933 RepID=UPI001CC0AED8|nr:hypothetical protein [Chryseobacterium lathyri]